MVTATVTGASGGGTPTGQVSFYGYLNGQTVPGFPISETLNGSGVATWTTSTLPPALYGISASYPGDDTHLISQLQSYAQEATFRVVGPPAAIAYENGFNYGYQYGSFSNLPLHVEVTDSAGYGIQGVTVNFSGSGLTFAPAAITTDATGNATVNFTAVKAGSLTATASVNGITSTLQIPITISLAPLTVTLQSRFRTYGAADPYFLYTIQGLIGSDTVTVTESTTATPSSPVGAYPITATVTGAASANYTLTVIPGTLYVRPATLHIVAKDEAVRYGATPATPTAYVLTGFVNGDTASVVSGAPVLSTTVTSTTPVGFYKIGVQTGTLTAANYVFTGISNGEGGVEVTQAHLALTANNLTMTQGSPVPTLTYTLTGFVNGQSAAGTVTGSPILSTTATSSSAPGKYPITISVGTLASANYFFQKANGVLTVLP